MPKHRIAYLELPSSNVAALKTFYGSLFGWTFQDYGEDYSAFSNAGLDGGFNASDEGRTKAPLMILETDAIEETAAQVRAAGNAG